MSLWLCCFLLCCLPYWRHDLSPGGSFIQPGMPSGLFFALKIGYAHNPLPPLACGVVAFQLLIEKQHTEIKLSLLLCLDPPIDSQRMPLPPAERQWPGQLSWGSPVRACLPNWTEEGTQATDESKQEKQPWYLTQQKYTDFWTNIAVDLSALLTHEDIGAFSFQPAMQLKSWRFFFVNGLLHF